MNFKKYFNTLGYSLALLQIIFISVKGFFYDNNTYHLTRLSEQTSGRTSSALQSGTALLVTSLTMAHRPKSSRSKLHIKRGCKFFSVAFGSRVFFFIKFYKLEKCFTHQVAEGFVFSFSI